MQFLKRNYIVYIYAPIWFGLGVLLINLNEQYSWNLIAISGSISVRELIAIVFMYPAALIFGGEAFLFNNLRFMILVYPDDFWKKHKHIYDNWLFNDFVQMHKFKKKHPYRRG